MVNDRGIKNPPLAAGDLWKIMRREAQHAIEADSIISNYFQQALLDHECLEEALCYQLAQKLDLGFLSTDVLYSVFRQQICKISEFSAAVANDVFAVYDRDAACHRYIDCLLYFKGFLALQAHRFAHSFWLDGRRDLAYLLQSRSSSVFQTDIHPAATIGRGVFLDHATGLVVGETAVIEDDVSILHDVTLGGTGKHEGDRHPKIRRGVLIGAGAIILGNIEIGVGAKVASGSVVLKSLPAYATAAGVPAILVSDRKNLEPALIMDQTFSIGEGI